MPTIKEIKTQNFTWVHLTKSGKKENKELAERFKFDESDLHDVLPPIQRAKLVERPDYLFVILLFPVFDHSSKKMHISELDLFLGQNFVVSANHGDDLEAIRALFELLVQNADERGKILNNTASLLREILSRETNALFPMLAHISNDIDAAEEKIFTNHGKKTASEMLRIKTNIVDFRRAVQSQPAIVEKLLKRGSKLFPIEHLSEYQANLLSNLKEVWDSLESNKETIDALYETHESLLSFHINEIMTTLMVISFITFPLTLVASIFGMNAKFMPIIGAANDFWIIIGVMILGVLGMLAFFKKKRWI